MRVPTTKFQNAFGKYLKFVTEEEEVIITKNNKAVAKLIKYNDPMSHVIYEEAAEYVSTNYQTYNDYLKLAEGNEKRYELIDGEIYVLASPGFTHQMILNAINVQIFNYLSKSSCGVYVAPFDVKLYNDAACFEDDPNVVQPDILVICDHENVDGKDRYQGKPSLVVEILSKSTRSKDLMKKLNLYVNSNIPEYWVVDPDAKDITLYEIIDRKITRRSCNKFGETCSSYKFTDMKVCVDI